MKTYKQIEEIENNIYGNWVKMIRPRTKYPTLSYEQGVEEALLWVMDQLDDEDFSIISDPQVYDR